MDTVCVVVHIFGSIESWKIINVYEL